MLALSSGRKQSCHSVGVCCLPIGVCCGMCLVQYSADCCCVVSCCVPQDLEVATGCFRHLRLLFQELEETRPFELLKGQVGHSQPER